MARLGPLIVIPKPERRFSHTLNASEDREVRTVGEGTEEWGRLVIEKRVGHWWIVDLWTCAEKRGQGVATELIKHAVFERHQLFLTRELDSEVFDFVGRLISRDVINGAVADLRAGNLMSFDPNKMKPPGDEPHI